MTVKNETILEIAREISEIREQQQRYLQEMIYVLNEIKKVLGATPFVDRQKIHYDRVLDATILCENTMREGSRWK
jgi:hypothetical protein